MRPFQTNQAAPRGLHRVALLLLGLFTVAWVPQSTPQRLPIFFETSQPGLTLTLVGPDSLTLTPQATGTLTLGSYAVHVRTAAGTFTEPQLDLARLLRPYPAANGLLVQALVVNAGVDLKIRVGLDGSTRLLLYHTVLGPAPAQVPAAPGEEEYDTFGDEPAGIMTHEAPATAPQKTSVGGVHRRAERKDYPSGHDTPQRNHPDSGGEEFGKLTPNAFKAVGNDPLSTFSIDVDRASYAFVRSYLQHGSLPPVDAVRTEELVNYFSYAYPRPQPGAEHPFSVTTEVATCPWAPTHQLVRIGLAAQQLALENLPPANLVFLLDVSGSMSDEDKLPLLKGALRLLVPQLRAQDRVAIVVYAGAAGLVLPSTPATQHQTILGALDRLEAGGSTAGGAGIELAYRVAQENLVPGGNNRVILCTDGDFNVGTSSESGLTSLIEAKRKTGVFLTVLGFGRGNTKDNFMELLADKGNGNYAYIDNLNEARKTLVEELGGTLVALAKDVKLQVEFNPATVKGYRLIGYENRLLRNEDFANDTIDAGELGAGHTVTALYELIPAGSPEVIPGSTELRYQTPRGTGAELLTVSLRYKRPTEATSRLFTHTLPNRTARMDDCSADFCYASGVAAFALTLRRDELRGSATYTLAQQLLKGGLGADPGGYRRECLTLVELAQALDRRPAN